MNRRHGRPFNHTVNRFTSSSIALFAAMTTQPTAARKATIDTLIRALMKAGIWVQLDLLYVTAAATSQAALLNWKNPTTFTLSAVNAPTFVADRGYTGDGASSRLNTAWTPSTNAVNFTQNNASMWLWSRTAAVATPIDMGLVGGSFGPTIQARTTGDLITGKFNDADSTSRTNTDGSGFIGVSRFDASNKHYWRNGAQLGTDVAVPSTGINTSPLWMLGADATNFSTRQQAAGAVGASLQGKESAFYTAMQAYMTALGA